MSETTDLGFDNTGSEDTVLSMRNCEVSYEMARGRARVLDDISLDIERGETLGIVGESGCGKSMFGSTLLNAVKDPGILTGEIIYQPEEGDPVDIVSLDRKEMNQIRWEEIAMVYQGSQGAFNPTLNVRTIFKETIVGHGRDQEEGMERAEELLREVNLEPERIFDAYQHELSGGEKQRTMVALSLVLDPEVIILDEPTAGLDLLTQRSLLQMLNRIKERYELTVIFITHDMPIAAGMVDRIAVMYAFDIVERGSAREVLYNPEHPYTRLLLQSTGSLSQPIEEIGTIEGETPDPINVPVGCSFHPRCPVADERCEAENPELRAPEDGGHHVACFYPDIAADEIPTSITEDE